MQRLPDPIGVLGVQVCGLHVDMAFVLYNQVHWVTWPELQRLPNLLGYGHLAFSSHGGSGHGATSLRFFQIPYIHVRNVVHLVK